MSDEAGADKKAGAIVRKWVSIAKRSNRANVGTTFQGPYSTGECGWVVGPEGPRRSLASHVAGTPMP